MNEFNLMVRGYNLREEKIMEKLALLACWVANPHLGRNDRYTVDKLLGRGMYAPKELKDMKFQETWKMIEEQRAKKRKEAARNGNREDASQDRS